jgi:hypothetical protein
VWVLGVLATFGNILVIGWRMRYKHTNQVMEAMQFAQQIGILTLSIPN